MIRLALLATAVPVVLTGCSAKLAERPPVIHDLTPLQDASRVLTNPHKGWYQHYYDNGTDHYPPAKDADVLEFPGLDHLYVRLSWAHFEPREGQFDWHWIDDLVAKWVP
jgi:hypothetical protein